MDGGLIEWVVAWLEVWSVHRLVICSVCDLFVGWLLC